jgi:hypothetical protein
VTSARSRGGQVRRSRFPTQYALGAQPPVRGALCSLPPCAHQPRKCARTSQRPTIMSVADATRSWARLLPGEWSSNCA